MLTPHCLENRHSQTGALCKLFTSSAEYLSSRYRPALPRTEDRLGRHRDRSLQRVADQTIRWAKIGEGFWPFGFADAVLIKRILGNGDSESSQ